MTTFQDGPAKGQNLMLKRAAKFLRVVQNIHAGTFDALDQPSDTPDKRETLHAYTIVGEPGMIHINRGGGRGGFYVIATYRIVQNQPSDAVMRDFVTWRDWCLAQPKT